MKQSGATFCCGLLVLIAGSGQGQQLLWQFTNQVAQAEFRTARAIGDAGTVVGWGDNRFGQATPPSRITNAIAVAAGLNHSLALKEDGTVVAWGLNTSGETNVPAGLSNVIAVAAGAGRSLALRSDGRVIHWGYETALVPYPTDWTNIIAIAAANYFSLALRENGTVAGWNIEVASNLPQNVVAIAAGEDEEEREPDRRVGFGVLSDGRVVDLLTAESAPCWPSNVISLAIGDYPPLALQRDGTVVEVDCPISTFQVDIVAISAREGHHLFLQSDGTLFDNGVVKPSWPYGFVAISVSGRYGLGIQVHGYNPLPFVNGQPVLASAITNVDSVTVELRSAYPGGLIFYTLDGRDSTLYTGPFTLHRTATIRALAYSADFLESSEAQPVTVVIIPSYPLTISTAGSGGSWSNFPAGSRFVSNAVVTVTATPDPGWIFLHWTGDTSGTDAAVSVTLDRPKSIQAVFGTSVRTTVGGQGRILIEPASGPYAYGSAVQLAAVPAPGYYFALWSGSFTGDFSPIELPVTTSSPQYLALFVPLGVNQASLAASVEGRGSIGGLNKNVFTVGQTVTLSAAPNAGWFFTGWSGDATNHERQIVVTMDKSKSITAHFASAVPPNISISPQSIAVAPGASVTFTATVIGTTPFAYQWQKNGVALGGATGPTLTLTGVHEGDSGSYSVIVTLATGTAVSPSAALLVDEPTMLGLNLYPGLTVNGTVGRTYRIDYSDDLVSPTNWTAITNIVLSESPFLWFDVDSTNASRRFYRSVSVP